MGDSWQDIVQRPSLHEQMKEMLLDVEWCANFNDGCGQRCPYCHELQGGDQHETFCRLGKICDTIRAIDKAKKLLREVGETL